MDNQMKRTVLAVGAPPDDVEMLCAGTLGLLHGRGWNVEVATMTPGDCGSATLSRSEISTLRKKEAAASLAVLEGGYHCLECDDVFIVYDRSTLLKVIALIRQVQPDIVFAMSPQDYMVDHEITSLVTRTGCFSAGMKNINTDGVKPLGWIPHLYYMDPIEGKDALGTGVYPTMVVDISTTMPAKEQMLLCHESQRSWLSSHHGMDEYVESMRALSSMRGQMAAVRYAEGFRQHLGHAFPGENILQRELGDFVHLLKYPGCHTKDTPREMAMRTADRSLNEG
jgi:LmbE family N-acetylglucosaminyl deacetylase